MHDTPVIVILAAGRGSRYQGLGHKLEQPFGNSTVLGTTIRHAFESQMPVVVVASESLVDEASRWVARRDIVVRPDVVSPQLSGQGMGDSIAAGVGARADAAGWLVLPGDMPLVKPQTLRLVAAALEHHPVIYAQYRGRRGHPVAFAAELCSDLLRLNGDEGARRIVARYPSEGVEVDDPGVLSDIDTAHDLAAAQAGGSAGAK